MRLNGTGDLIRSLEYPTTRDELVDEHGDSTIELQRGDETLGEVLGRIDQETYEDEADIVAVIRSGVSHRAIGRRHYSDRDAFAPGESGHDPVSF
ncbi:MAG: DUF2795 domain-containing protein [Haloferacaceae archaeon]